MHAPSNYQLPCAHRHTSTTTCTTATISTATIAHVHDEAFVSTAHHPLPLPRVQTHVGLPMQTSGQPTPTQPMSYDM